MLFHPPPQGNSFSNYLEMLGFSLCGRPTLAVPAQSSVSYQGGKTPAVSDAQPADQLL